MEGTVNLVDVWPLFGLELATPRLQLRPVRDHDLPALIECALSGVHDPAYQPFDFPWATQPKAELPANTAQFHWGRRSSLTPDDWSVEFGIHLDGHIVGSQGLMAKDFARTRSVSTGSWLAQQYQGLGIGNEMRAAVLMFAFDHLHASEATTHAWEDNGPSNGVSKSLGYLDNGIERQAAGEGYRIKQNYRMSPEHFRRPEWELRVDGFSDKVKAQLGLGSARRPSEQ